MAHPNLDFAILDKRIRVANGSRVGTFKQIYLAAVYLLTPDDKILAPRRQTLDDHFWKIKPRPGMKCEHAAIDDQAFALGKSLVTFLLFGGSHFFPVADFFMRFSFRQRKKLTVAMTHANRMIAAHAMLMARCLNRMI